MYTTRLMELTPKIEETQDLYEKPIIEFFADKEELGDYVEITFKEYCVFGHDYEVTGTHLITRNEANEEYAKLIKNGYSVTKNVIN